VLATVLQNIVGIKQFKIVQRRDYAIEVQTIAADKAYLEKVALAIESTLTPLTRGLQIKVLFTDSIEVKGAKFRLVESQVPK
jgi:hypothetical protein